MAALSSPSPLPPAHISDPGSVAQCINQVNVHVVISRCWWRTLLCQGRELICTTYSFAALGPGCIQSLILTILDVIQIAIPSVKEGTPFDVVSSDFFSQYGGVKVPYCCQLWRCVSGEGELTLCWVYNQQILILRTRVELKCLSPELLFQGLNYKSNLSFKALIISRLPLQRLAASVCSHYSRGCVCWFMPLNGQGCHLAISLTVIMDGLFAAYLFLSSAHLDSCWFCLVNNLTG